MLRSRLASEARIGVGRDPRSSPISNTVLSPARGSAFVAQRASQSRRVALPPARNARPRGRSHLSTSGRTAPDPIGELALAPVGAAGASARDRMSRPLKSARAAPCRRAQIAGGDAEPQLVLSIRSGQAARLCKRVIAALTAGTLKRISIAFCPSSE
jgi:hypothetical protein